MMSASATAARSRSSSGTSARRRWASGRELDRIERLAFAYRAQLPPTTFLRILPVAVDANVLLRAVTRVARGNLSDLVTAAREGAVRIYVGENVPAEVDEHLADLASATRVSIEDLQRIWQTDVRPLLRVVETGMFEHPSLAAIIARDPDDRPTAVLSLFVGARLTWSFDKDLNTEGYAERLNVAIVVAAQKVGQFDLSAHLALNISSESLSAAARTMMRAVERPGPQRTVAIAVVLLAAGALTVAVIKDPQRVRQSAARVAQIGMEGLQELAKYRTDQSGKLPAIPAPAATEPLPVRMAHALAVAPAPLTIDEIVSVLTATGALATDIQVEATLRTYSAFVMGRHGWQLGSW